MQIDESYLRNLQSRAPTRVGLWKDILATVDVRVAAEFGVWKGNFASKILTNCEFIERYYMVDPWAYLPDWNRAKNVQTENFEDVYDQAMAATSFAETKRTVLRGTTKDVIHNIPDNSLDFAYIDGDHTLRGVTIDFIKVLPKMKPGAIIGGDDFWPKPFPRSPKFEPTMVCPFSIYFAEANNLPVFALPFHQCLILNQPELGFSFTDITGLYADISLIDSPGTQTPQNRPKMKRAARLAARARRNP
jgi:hypothetical protein